MRYAALFAGSLHRVTVPTIHDRVTEKLHPRPDYTDVQLGSLARWLNERNAGYPTLITLDRERLPPVDARPIAESNLARLNTEVVTLMATGDAAKRIADGGPYVITGGVFVADIVDDLRRLEERMKTPDPDD